MNWAEILKLNVYFSGLKQCAKYLEEIAFLTHHWIFLAFRPMTWCNLHHVYLSGYPSRPGLYLLEVGRALNNREIEG
jgi:hypothetical protein